MSITNIHDLKCNASYNLSTSIFNLQNELIKNHLMKIQWSDIKMRYTSL